MNKLKTSEAWQKDCVLTVLDPDGWDRKNFEYSWYEEQITREEFEIRLINSTIRGKITSKIWLDK